MQTAYTKDEIGPEFLALADIAIDSASATRIRCEAEGQDVDSTKMLETVARVTADQLGVDEGKLTAAMKCRLKERA